jgi:hypothetical protein
MVDVSKSATGDDRRACACDKPEPIGFAGPVRGSMLDPDPGPSLDELDWNYSCMNCGDLLPGWPPSTAAAGHLLHNIFAAPAEPGPPYTHVFDPSPPDPDEAVAWLREQINWWLEYARKNAARRPITPMRSHEMRGMIARCEAELAILGEHGPADFTAYGNQMCRRCVWGDDEPDRDDDAHHWVFCPCRTIRLLAAGYRHREGYARFWGEPVTHTLTEGGQ